VEQPIRRLRFDFTLRPYLSDARNRLARVNNMLEKKGVHVRFLLGPAGTGKTFQCLHAIRTELTQSPQGLPLLFLAPKQATFQIERQLLADESLEGFTRLHIVSFERLASHTLTALGLPEPRLLNNEGRVMILRALLARHHRELQLFRASARLPGFAQQLSSLLRELQCAQISPERLAELAAKRGDTPLARKLADIAFLYGKYLDWLAQENVQDADRLLDIAAMALNEAAKTTGVTPRFGGLWLDGFAEMTEQELSLLQAFLPWCTQATLAFCCEPSAFREREGFTLWSLVAHTARRCFNAVTAVVPDAKIVSLERDPATYRFSTSPEIAHIERHWGHGASFPDAPAATHIVRCVTPEDEVTFAAREICRHVRGGGRHRDVSVLVRRLEPYQDIVRRVFARYEIPCFIDRRESIAHHPLAELTRFTLRTVAFGWKTDDWFGLLKSGLVTTPDLDVDWLENEALARGWEGQQWLEPIHIEGDPVLTERLEALRSHAIKPLRDFQAQLAGASGAYKPTGLELANALRQLWRAFRVSEQLNEWAEESSAAAVHATAWDQMNEWLQTLALGFAHEPVPLREWLPIVEAGLAGLTVGVIPPALDQVLVGSIDRSRSPDLRIAFVLGVNEGIFPAPPPDPVLLTESDRTELQASLHLAASPRQQLAHERFYGYIALTRPREKLFVTFSEADRQGRKLHPSVFITHLQRLFPLLTIENGHDSSTPAQAVHPTELFAPLLRAAQSGDPAALNLLQHEVFEPVRSVAETWRQPRKSKLSSEIVERLYPQRLVTSVSRLEEFAACRFRFFIKVGLRAKERLRYEVDVRHTGTFQHEVLKAFHERVRAEFKSWHNITPATARNLIKEIANALLPVFKDGVLIATDRARVESGNLISALEDFIETIVGWMTQYEFEPAAVELQFGDGGPLPPWELDLAGGRKLAFTGSVDRVDLWVDPATRTAHVVVMDYKSSARNVDATLLASGVQMQLFAYLSALRKVPQAAALFGAERVAAAGVFYVTLRGTYASAARRDEVLANATDARRDAYKHRGRFIHELLSAFDKDHRTRGNGDQFSYRLKKDGGLYANCVDPIPAQTLNELLDAVEQQLTSMGNSIFAGDISANPYRHANKTPCEHCDYGSVCRIDHWTHEFRALSVKVAE
jgi:ATP-dependent helicase/nuclease subunit B